MGDRGMGRVFLPRYKDKSGVLRDAAVWWIAYYHNGKEVRESSKSKNRNMAVKLLKDRLAAQASGTLVTVEAQRLGFEEMVERLFRDYRLKARRSLDRAEDAVTHLRYFFGMYRGLDITDSLVEAYVDHRVDQEGAATSTVHYELALLKRMFRLCRKLLLVHPEFPVLRAQNIRQGFFEEQEFRALLSKLPADLVPAVEFAYLTGWRVKSEVLSLRWGVNIDFTAGEVRLEPGTTKNDEGRVFPFKFLPELEKLIGRQWARTEAVQKEKRIIVPWVFHRRGRQILDFRKAWKIALQEAELAKKIPHDFRRTAVRNLERAGVPRSVAMRLVGHKTESIYRRYAIVAPRDLEDGLKRLADFRAVVTEESAAKGKVKRFRGKTRHLP